MRTNKFIPLLLALFLHALPFGYLLFSQKNITQNISPSFSHARMRTFDLESFSFTKKTPLSNVQKSPNKTVGFFKDEKDEKNEKGDKNIDSSSSHSASNLSNQTVQFLKYNDPTYPPIARQKGFEGIIKIKIYYNQDGIVTKVDLTKSSGIKMLDEAVLRTASDWKLEKNKEGYLEKTFEFKLNK